MASKKEQISLDVEQVEGLENLSKALDKRSLAIANTRAINVAIRKAHTQYRRRIVSQYNLKYGQTKGFGFLKRATYSNVEGTVSGIARPLSFSRFSPMFFGGDKTYTIKQIKGDKKGKRKLSQTSRRAKGAERMLGGVSIEIRKGHPIHLPSAFMIQSQKNPGLSMQVWARGEYTRGGFTWAKERMPITPLKTTSPASAMRNPTIAKEIEKGATVDMTKEFERQVELLMSKYNRVPRN